MAYQVFTQNGYPLDEIISALQKDIRRGNEEQALYWVLELLPRFEAAVRALGLPTIPLDMSEYRKLDGGLSCLSLRF